MQHEPIYANLVSYEPIAREYIASVSQTYVHFECGMKIIGTKCCGVGQDLRRVKWGIVELSNGGWFAFPNADVGYDMTPRSLGMAIMLFLFEKFYRSARKHGLKAETKHFETLLNQLSNYVYQLPNMDEIFRVHWALSWEDRLKHA